tara:strand:- start:29 stop:244 length:216 start_codon:yes stop_codon:yes gene_type:complete
MAKLKERQFYNVGSRKTEMVPTQYIEVVKFKNGIYALLGVSKKNENMFKIFPQDKLDKMEKKYGKSKKYKR